MAQDPKAGYGASDKGPGRTFFAKIANMLQHNTVNRYATSNKCVASSNKCLTSSNKKLYKKRGISAFLVVLQILEQCGIEVCHTSQPSTRRKATDMHVATDMYDASNCSCKAREGHLGDPNRHIIHMTLLHRGLFSWSHHVWEGAKADGVGNLPCS